METGIVEFNPTKASTQRARMKLSYQALSRILQGNFFPIENCTAPPDLLVLGIQSEENAYHCWVEYHSKSLPETDLSQPLPETKPWEYVPANVWLKMLELSEKIDRMIDEASDSDTDPFISCKELSATFHEIINGRKIQ